MKKVKTYISITLAGIMALSFTGCNMIKRTKSSLGKVVLAKVGDEKITRADVDAEIQTTLDYYEEQYGEDFEENADIIDTLKSTRQSVLDTLVNNAVLLQKAEELKLVPSDEEINEEVEKTIQSYKDNVAANSTDTASLDDEFKEFLDYYGYTEETFRTYLEEQYVISKVVEDMTKDQSVTDEEISTYYNENKDSFSREAGADVYNLLLNDEETAKEIKSKITSLDDFKKYADEYNTDSTKGIGGYLGYLPYENSGMIEEFVEGFKNLSNDTVSDPVKSSYGWHLIYVQNASNEAYDATLEQATAEIRSTLLNNKKQQAYNDKLDQYKEELGVKTYEDKL